MITLIWIIAIAAALVALAYVTIFACVVAAKWRMTHAPAKVARRAGGIVDLRYRMP